MTVDILATEYSNAKGFLIFGLLIKKVNYYPHCYCVEADFSTPCIYQYKIYLIVWRMESMNHAGEIERVMLSYSQGVSCFKWA